MSEITTPIVHLPLNNITYDSENKRYITENKGSNNTPFQVFGDPRNEYTSDLGSCMVFDGDGDYLQWDEDATKNLNLINGLTIAAWVKFDAFPNYSRILDINDERNKNEHIIFLSNQGGDSKLFI